MHLTVGSHRSASGEREVRRSVRERGRGAGCCLWLSGAGLPNWAEGEEESSDAMLDCQLGRCGWAVGAEAAERAKCRVGRGKNKEFLFYFFPISIPHSNMNQIKFE